jgi:hypothetical protein
MERNSIVSPDPQKPPHFAGVGLFLRFLQLTGRPLLTGGFSAGCQKMQFPTLARLHQKSAAEAPDIGKTFDSRYVLGG